jgi:hypothetical protein
MNGPKARLDVLSEMITLSTFGDTKNIVLTAMDLRGPIDMEAVILAVTRASKEFPQIMSSLREVRHWGRHYLEWVHRPDITFPATITDYREDIFGPMDLQGLLGHLRPRLDQNWNLFEEVAVEFQAVRVSAEQTILVSMCHHTASDAGTASDFGKAMLGHYHEIITGEKPDWAISSYGVSTSAKKPVIVKKPTLKEFLENGRRSIDQMFEKPMLPAGSGNPDDNGQHHIKRVLSTEDTLKIGISTARNAVSPVDMLTACANLAIDRWNALRNTSPGLLTTSMTVNTRGRFSQFETPNNSALIFFRSTPEDRKDPFSYSRSLALARIKHFRNQMDIKFVRDIQLLMAAIRPLPEHLRRRIVHKVMQLHEFSIGITLLGVIWPKFEQNRPTGESNVTETANLTIEEVHGLGYKLLSNTRTLLIIYLYRNRLNLILAAHASLFTRQEAENFLDTIIEQVMDGCVAMSMRHKK